MLSTLSSLEQLKLVDEESDHSNKSVELNKVDKSKNDMDEDDEEGDGEEEDENNYDHKPSGIQYQNQRSHQLGMSRGGGGGGGGVGYGGCIQKQPMTKPKPPAHSSKPLIPSGGGLVPSQDRRNRPPPPTQSKPARDLKGTTMSSTKHLPDTR